MVLRLLNESHVLYISGSKISVSPGTPGPFASVLSERPSLRVLRRREGVRKTFPLFSRALGEKRRRLRVFLVRALGKRGGFLTFASRSGRDGGSRETERGPGNIFPVLLGKRKGFATFASRFGGRRAVGAASSGEKKAKNISLYFLQSGECFLPLHPLPGRRRQALRGKGKRKKTLRIVWLFQKKRRPLQPAKERTAPEGNERVRHGAERCTAHGGRVASPGSSLRDWKRQKFKVIRAGGLSKRGAPRRPPPDGGGQTKGKPGSDETLIAFGYRRLLLQWRV